MNPAFRAVLHRAEPSLDRAEKPVQPAPYTLCGCILRGPAASMARRSLPLCVE